MTRRGFTCKPGGSCILPAFVLLDVTVIGLDRDDRLLRAEDGREDDRLSEIHQRQTSELTEMNTNTETHTLEKIHKSSHNTAANRRESSSDWLTDEVQPTPLQTVNTLSKERWAGQHNWHRNLSSLYIHFQSGSEDGHFATSSSTCF